jgi:hypothetical protein
MCKKYREIQILVWNDDLDIYVLDVAQVVGTGMYYHRKKVNKFVGVGIFPIMGVLYLWNPQHGDYEKIGEKVFECEPSEKMANIKLWARNNGTIIALGR